MDIIDSEGLCTARLFREHCTIIDNLHVKDLSKLGRKLENVIIIDNSPNSYRLHLSNAVPIKTWYDDPHDTELLQLVPFLIQLTEVDDVRDILKQCVSICKTGEFD